MIKKFYKEMPCETHEIRIRKGKKGEEKCGNHSVIKIARILQKSSQ